MQDHIAPIDAEILAAAERMGTWPPLLADNDDDAFEHAAPKPRAGDVA